MYPKVKVGSYSLRKIHTKEYVWLISFMFTVMEAPVDSSDSEDGSDESMVFTGDFEEEVDINIHFHCEHCVKTGKCQERPKPGWACEIDYCPNSCGHKSV